MTIYLDNNATTGVHPRVFAAMEPYLRTKYGNPSSVQHEMGRQARRALMDAREKVAALIRCSPEEVLFTGGGSEANSQAVFGTPTRGSERRIVTSPIEHDSVRRACIYAQMHGVLVETVPVDAKGMVRLDALDAALEMPVSLVTIMWVNNETGVIQPIERVVELARSRGALVHSDGVQALGKLEVDLSALPLDLMTLSAHKVHGPKGVGALFVRNGVDLEPRIFGGPQERGLRSGTENVAGIVGFGEACALLLEREASAQERIRSLRDMLESGLLRRCPGAVVFGSREHRVSNTLLVGWEGLGEDDILKELDRVGIFASSGSACTSQDPEPSHVLMAMGVPLDLARGAIRFSLCEETTEGEIVTVLEAMEKIIGSLQMRSTALAWEGDFEDA
jgi:cysteine desulfurase